MSNTYTEAVIQYFLNTLRSYDKTKIPTDYHGQMTLIDKVLKDDHSSLVRTLYNFMINAATVDYNFETGNNNLDKRLTLWKENVNNGVSFDIQPGLRALSEQYFRERWRSSFLILNIQFEEVDDWMLPTKMWFMDGAQINVTGNTNVLGGYKYHIGKKATNKPLIAKNNRQILVRKPYNMWYDKWPTPYLISTGAIYHALSKNIILSKQNDLMAEVIPFMLLNKVGNDIMAKQGNLPNETELKDIENKVKKMSNNYKCYQGDGTTIGTFPYDVEFSQMIPDVTKFINEDILKPSDRNLLASMGMIEMEGFAKSRQETILNPKVMVEEVTDAVLDWRDMLKEVAKMTWEMNQDAHPKDTNRRIRVVPGLIRAFLTNDDKVLIRSAFDRGSVGHQDFVTILPFDWETTMNRRIRERDNGLDEKLYPHVIMNQEQHPNDPDVNPESTKEETPEKQKSEKDVETSEIEDFKQLPRMQAVQAKSDQELILAPYDTIDELPDSVKNVLPVGAQVIWLKAFNSALEAGNDEETAIKIAWSAVKKKYKKDPKKKKWVKK